MSRRDGGVMFYRVLFVSLLGIAFIFSVILTNVFVNIDGWIYNKVHEAEARTNEAIENEIKSLQSTKEPQTDRGRGYLEEEDNAARTKRSPGKLGEAQNYLFRIKNPKVKKLLSDHLESLLEQLDSSATTTEKIAEKLQKNGQVIGDFADDKEDIKRNANARENILYHMKLHELLQKAHLKLQKDEQVKGDVANDEMEDIKRNANEKQNIYHMKLHDLLLDGLFKHNKLEDIFENVHSIVDGFQDVYNGKNDKLIEYLNGLKLNDQITPKTDAPEPNTRSTANRDEISYMDELIKCQRILSQIREAIEKKIPLVPRPGALEEKAFPKLLIKTVIDISSLDNIDNQNETISGDSFAGIVDVNFNGKPVNRNPSYEKITNLLRDFQSTLRKNPNPFAKFVPDNILKEKRSGHKEVESYGNIIPKNYVDAIVEDYYKITSKKKLGDVELLPGFSIQDFATKRLKRHVKFHYSSNNKNNQENEKNKKHDDNLYIEIETNLDKKSEDAKKKIKTIVKKIQEAINSDEKQSADHKKKTVHSKHWHIKKRIQNPLDILEQSVIEKADSSPRKHVISKIKHHRFTETVPDITKHAGQDFWSRKSESPKLISPSKSINSAELNELNIDYDKVLTLNGIPQRLQTPIVQANGIENFFGLGDMKFTVKELGSSGLAIGFNQYTDSPPETETLNLFMGLEDLIKQYTQNYETIEDIHDGPKSYESKMIHPIAKRHAVFIHKKNKSTNVISDSPTSKYSNIFGNDILPYPTYQEIFDRRNQDIFTGKQLIKSRGIKQPEIVTDDILAKKLKPSEIFRLANLFKRRKRSAMNIQRIGGMTNKKHFKRINDMSNKVHMSKFLNTRAMNVKKFSLKKKRNKRQISNVRVLREGSVETKNYEETPSSYEQIFADRATVADFNPSIYFNKPDDETDTSNIFLNNIINSVRRKHSKLMLRYPHLFTVESSEKDREPQLKTSLEQSKGYSDTEHKSVTVIPENTAVPNLQKIVELMSPLNAKRDFKVTVRVLPKNNTKLPDKPLEKLSEKIPENLSDSPTFKEVHTSVNRTFNKNGMRYYTVLNVSEISQIEQDHIHEHEDKQKSKPLFKKTVKYTVGVKDDTMNKTLNSTNNCTTVQNANDVNITVPEQIHNKTKDTHKTDSQQVDCRNASIGNETKCDKDLIEIHFPHSNSNVHFKKDELSKLVSIALTKTRDQSNAKEVRSPTTTTATTAKPVEPSPSYINKLDILLSNHMNLTQEVLKKIDHNTNMLSVFLNKIIIMTENAKKEKLNNMKNFNYQQQLRESFPVGTKIKHTDLNHSESENSMPFVYAYQNANGKKNCTQRSVEYHDHIHPNVIEKDAILYWKDPRTVLPNHDDKGNDTGKFFIDIFDTGASTAAAIGNSVVGRKSLLSKCNNTETHDKRDINC